LGEYEKFLSHKPQGNHKMATLPQVEKEVKIPKVLSTKSQGTFSILWSWSMLLGIQTNWGRKEKTESPDRNYPGPFSLPLQIPS